MLWHLKFTYEWCIPKSFLYSNNFSVFIGVPCWCWECPERSYILLVFLHVICPSWFFHRDRFGSTSSFLGIMNLSLWPSWPGFWLFGQFELFIVTFCIVLGCSWAQWTLHRYLLYRIKMHMGTVSSPSLPFISYWDAHGHGELSFVTFCIVLRCKWARGTLHRYLLYRTEMLMGTVDSPSLPFVS